MAEETLSPISSAKPPVANPITPAGSGEAATLKLKPVLRKPTPGGAPTLNIPVKPVVRAPINQPVPPPAAPKAPDVPKALDQLKSVTQKLKGVTQEIPQQAILRKTGIISDQAMTEAQKQASKARTARISLSDAFGAAPVKESSSPAPMKTIRIKRPLDIPGSGAAKPAPAAAEAAPAPAPAPAAAEPAPAPAADATLTQRKTLKVARPAGGPARPTAKFSVKKPGSTAITKQSPADGAAPAAGAEGDVADIADIPEMPASNVVSAFSSPAQVGEKDVPLAVTIVSLIVQVAACLVVGALGYMLYTNTQTPMF